MRKEEEAIVDEFIEDFEHVVGKLTTLSGYLNMPKEASTLREDALAILNKKLKKIKKADNISDLKKHVKVKKLIEKNGDHL